MRSDLSRLSSMSGAQPNGGHWVVGKGQADYLVASVPELEPIVDGVAVCRVLCKPCS